MGFVGRPIEVCATVTNSGNAASEGTVVEVDVPAGASFRGASSGGQLVGNKVVWNLGILAADGSTEVCANFVGTTVEKKKKKKKKAPRLYPRLKKKKKKKKS